MRIKRKRGGQPGNQNARKHGFYSAYMSLPEIGEFWQALNLGGDERELIAFRIKLSSALRWYPHNPRVLREASCLLSKWFRSKCRLAGAENTEIKKFIRNIIKDIGEKFAGTNHSQIGKIAPKLPERIETEKTKQLPCSATN